MNTWDVAHGDLKLFESHSLISLSASMGGLSGLQVLPLQGVRDRAEELRARRADRGLRRTQCRDAMVDWLHSIDAVSATDIPVTESMLEDTRHGIWFGEPFTARDLDKAAAWLHQQGLVEGATTGEDTGPVMLHLTDAGVTCAEDYGSDTGRYIQAQRAPGSGPTVNIHGDNSGPFQIAGDHARQEQHIGASADELRAMITGLAELVATLVPGTADVAEQRETALAAARDRAVDVTVLRRFRNWVVATVGRGVSAAAAQMVTTGADEMMHEAMRLAGHL
jgi:hypothetical protein